MTELWKAAEKVLEERVRPRLADHSGNIEIVSLEDGVLKVQFTGQCSGCPSAYLTLEEVVKEEVMEHIPEISDVILDTGVSEDMLLFAKKFLGQKR